MLKPAAFVMDLLKRRYREQAAQRMAAGELWQAWNTPSEQKQTLVFTTAIGNHLRPATVYNHYKKMAAQIGAPESRVHDLRHSCATLLLENGATLKQVQEWLGHHSYVVTADTYGHVLAESKREMADTMSKLLGKEQAV